MDRIWIGTKDVPVDSAFATCEVSSFNKVCDAWQSGNSSGVEEERDECDPKPL